MTQLVTRRSVLGGTGALVAGSLVGFGAPATEAEAAGRRWLSGACDDTPQRIARGGFGRWRGEASTYARIWCDRGDDQTQIYMLDAYASAGWRGTLDIANGGPSNWGDAARGGMDRTWTAFCRTLNRKWHKLQGVHLSMAHELNGDWYKWSVGRGEVQNFKKAWRRWHGIVHRELVAKGRPVKLCLSFNSDSRAVPVSHLYPGSRYVDLIGCDFYDAYHPTRGGHLGNAADWNRHKNDTQGGSPRGIQAWFDYARRIGKPISFPEWGTSPHSVHDSPFFIGAMYNTFRAHAPARPHSPGAGQLAGEAYFNAWKECRLWPDSHVPRSAARYKALRFGG